MKKPQRVRGYSVTAYLRQIPMLLVFVLASLGVFAQDSGSREQSGNDPVQDYVNANTETSLVRFYLAHPEDGDAARAVKYAAILANPVLFPDMDEQALSRMKSELELAGKRTEFMNEQIRNGATYERANALYERKAASQSVEKSSVNENQTGAPSIMAAPNN